MTGEPVPPDGQGLRQLVFVSTSWREWREEQDPHLALERLIRALIAPAGGVPGRAWLADASARGEAGPGWWRSGREAGDALSAIVPDLPTRDATGPAAGDEPLPRLGVLCDPRRTQEVFPATQDGRPMPACWTVLDTRFLRYAGALRLHLTFSFWASRPPWRPAEVTDEPRLIEPQDVPRIRDSFLIRARAATRSLVDQHLGAATTRVAGHEYAQPVFWIAGPACRAGDPAAYLEEESTRNVALPLLGCDITDEGVAGGVLGGNVLALRRLRPERRPDPDHPIADRPVYLLFPGAARSHDGTSANLEIQRAISELIEIEALAATEMDAIDGDLEVWRSHIVTYGATAHQAGDLWDALALHLPVRKARELQRNHRAIALVHQALLQGGADLAEIVSVVDELTSRVDEVADELSVQFGRHLTERRLSAETPGLRESLIGLGQFGSLRRRVGSVAVDARRVRDEYKDLLASIAHAFDERRVRELDVLQRGGWTLNIAVAGVTLVSVLDFILDVHLPRASLPGSLPAIGFAIGLGVLVLWTAVFAVLRVVGARHITSRRFRRRYEDVLSYLRDTATVSLDRRPADTDWRRLDVELAERLARAWDSTAAPADAMREARGDDIARLTAEVEAWAQRALLLTERPRRMAQYELPVLTMLYRHLGELGDGALPERARRIVPDADVHRALNRQGYHRPEVRALDAEVTEIVTSGEAESRPLGAMDLLERIRDVFARHPRASDLARGHRAFVRRVVTHLAERGIRQFIDVGTGIPTHDGVHQIARRVHGTEAGAVRVVYIDNAPDAFVQSLALLADVDTAVLSGDMRRSQDIFGHARFQRIIRTDEPVAVLFTRVFDFVRDDAEARAVIDAFRAVMAPGSALVVSHATPGTKGARVHASTASAGAEQEELPRPRETIEGFFREFRLDPQGLVNVTDWHADGTASGSSRPKADGVHIIGGVAWLR